MRLKALKRLMNERRRGSTVLAGMALECFRELAHTRMTGRRFEASVRRLAETLISARPSMPLIAKFADEVVRRFYSSFEGGGDPRGILLKCCRDVEDEYDAMVGRLISHASDFLRRFGSVITLSHSGTVERILIAASGVRRAIVLESRPNLEGRIMAKALSRYKDVTLVVDGAAGYGVGEADACLVGADALFPDGSFVGKVGCLPLALLCQKFGKPFYVACDLWKMCERVGYVVEEGAPNEVWRGRGGVAVRNPYFEIVEPYLVTSYLTDRGPLKPSELATAI